MTAARQSVVWVAPCKMGGVLTIVGSLLAHRTPGDPAHHVLLTRNHLEGDVPFEGWLGADTQQTVEYRLPIENLHAVLRRLHAAVPPGAGVLVANDLLELAMATAFDTGRTVIQVLHGDYDYYYDLAVRHEPVVDVFVAYAQGIAGELRRRLPARAADVLCLPYGVEIPARPRAARSPDPIRLLFVGRLGAEKGIFDLPAIDARLAAAGIRAQWTVVGGGPDGERLRRQWLSPHVAWTGALAPRDVLALYPYHDVFVLPSRAEGFPVTLLEAMAAGLVPVVTDLPSGVREAVTPGATGFLAPMGDAAAFAEAIASVARDHVRLNAIGAAARAHVARLFDIRDRVAAYERLFARHASLHRPRPARVAMPYGSRLDRPWIPNAAVKAVRTVVRRAHGKPV